MLNGYYCKSSYQTERGIANATSKCKEDTNCAMVSTLQCNDEDSVYSLCESSTELFPKLGACTRWKIVPHCLDKSQNEDESGIDCGGSCKPCQVSVEIKYTGIEEANGISWSISDTNCKSILPSDLRPGTEYKQDCDLAMGQSYILNCESPDGSWWKSNYVVIENSVYCEYAQGTKVS